MKATKNIDIYVINKKPVKVIDVVQYDTGIQLVFTVKDFPIPTDATATLYVEKPSGNFVYQKDNITVFGNTITVDLENQALTEHGRIPYQVTVTSGSDTFTTFTGLMMVERSLKDAGAVESKTVIKAFDEVTIDEIAEFQANARIIADAVIATIPDDYTELSAKVNESANAIKGKLSGAVVVADDVSPVEHLMNVNVHGKNLFDISKISTMSPSASAYVSEVGGDYIVITTPEGYTSNGYCTISRPLKEFCPSLKVGKTYTIKAVTESNSANIYLPKVGKSWVFGYSMVMTDDILNSSVTFYGLSAQHNQGVGTCRISNIQIEEGTVATEYTPYVDPSTVKVEKCGKNILKHTITDRTVAGLNFTVDKDGKITVNGTATSTTYTPVGSVNLKAGKTYILSGCPLGGNSSSYRLDLRNTNTSLYEPNVFDYGNGVMFTPEEDVTLVVGLRYAIDAVISNVRFSPMIQVANNADVLFEPYNGTEYIPTSDGVVSGVASISPNMTLLTDTEGVVVECEYNKDTNKVIKKITDALGITI